MAEENGAQRREQPCPPGEPPHGPAPLRQYQEGGAPSSSAATATTACGWAASVKASAARVFQSSRRPLPRFAARPGQISIKPVLRPFAMFKNLRGRGAEIVDVLNQALLDAFGVRNVCVAEVKGVGRAGLPLLRQYLLALCFPGSFAVCMRVGCNAPRKRRNGAAAPRQDPRDRAKSADRLSSLDLRSLVSAFESMIPPPNQRQ